MKSSLDNIKQQSREGSRPQNKVETKSKTPIPFNRNYFGEESNTVRLDKSLDLNRNNEEES